MLNSCIKNLIPKPKVLILENMGYREAGSDKPKQECVFLKELPSLRTDAMVFHLPWKNLASFGYFCTLYDELMYFIVTDLWHLLNKFNIQDILIFDNVSLNIECD